MTHCRVERHHAIADLFRAVPPQLRRYTREVSVPGAGGATWTFTLPYALDDPHQTLFLTILAQLGELRKMEENVRRIMPPEAAEMLALRGAAAQGGTYQLRTSMHALIRACGWAPSGKRRKLVVRALEDMAAATFRISKPGVGEASGGQVLSYVALEDGRMGVAVNPYLAFGLLGKFMYAKIDLEERRQLPSATARLAHAWLSAWLRPGQHGRIKLHTLARHIWRDHDTAPAGTVRRRHHELAAALRTISGLRGWRITVTGAMVLAHRRREPGQRAKFRRKKKA